MTRKAKASSAAFLVVSGSAAIAQIVNPTNTAGLVSDAWKQHGLVGVQSLALVLAIGVLGWMVQRLFGLVVQVVKSITEVKAALEALVESLKRMPCAWLEQRSRPKDGHQTPEPFENVRMKGVD